MVNPGPHLAYSDGTLVAASGAQESGWLEVGNHERITVTKTSTGGTYALEVDWGRDGSTADYTQVVVINDIDPVEIKVSAPYAKFRVQNTDGVAAFTAHRTNVMVFAR